MGRRYVYLGKRVKDIGSKGLDTITEVRRIKNEILKDFKSGRIDIQTARGRLLCLYRQVINPKANKALHAKYSMKTLRKVASEIRKAMKSLSNMAKKVKKARKR